MAKDVLSYNPTTTNTETSAPVPISTGEVTEQFVNETGQAINYTIQGTYDGDSSFGRAVNVASGSVSAGSTAAVTVTEPWDRLRVKVTPQTAPTSGAVVVKQHESE